MLAEVDQPEWLLPAELPAGPSATLPATCSRACGAANSEPSCGGFARRAAVTGVGITASGTIHVAASDRRYVIDQAFERHSSEPITVRSGSAGSRLMSDRAEHHPHSPSSAPPTHRHRSRHRRQASRRVRDIRRLVAFSPHRHRRQIRAIGFDQEPVGRYLGCHLAQNHRRSCTSPSRRTTRAGPSPGTSRPRASRRCTSGARRGSGRGGRIGREHPHHVVLGFAAMDDHRQVRCGRARCRAK